MMEHFNNVPFTGHAYPIQDELPDPRLPKNGRRQKITTSICSIYQGKNPFTATQLAQKKETRVFALGYKTKWLYCSRMFQSSKGENFNHDCFDNTDSGYKAELDTWREIGANVICCVRRNSFDQAASKLMLEKLQFLCKGFKNNADTKNITNCVLEATHKGINLNPRKLISLTKIQEKRYLHQKAICDRAANQFGMKVMMVHYEDLVLNTRKTLEDVQRFILPEGAPLMPYEDLDKHKFTKINTALDLQIKNWKDVVLKFRENSMHHYILSSNQVSLNGKNT